MSVSRGLKRDILNAILGSKMGLLGLTFLLSIVILSVIAVFYVPFDIAKRWNDPSFWQRNPRLAAPAWINFFLSKKLPETIILNQESFTKYSYVLETAGMKYTILEGSFDYIYESFPSEITLFFHLNANSAFLTVYWIQPNNIEITVWKGIARGGTFTLHISSQKEVRAQIMESLNVLGLNIPELSRPEIILFSDNSIRDNSPSPLNGRYKLKVESSYSDLKGDINAELIVYGRVYGLAGTDDKRRDLFVGLVWGAPIALAFGLIAAVTTNFIQTFVGALSAWYGGVADEIIQRITDVYMIIPFLPILITISVVYRIDIWTLLTVVVILTVFGGMTKTSRSMALQIMTEQYIEAAVSYGASRIRILLLYILPRLLPYTIANIVLSVPGYVFLEAALSVLGLGDPMMPTWGKIISDAYSGGAVIHGLWWWIIIPSTLIVLTAISFAFIGLALDKVVNPRLRER